MPLAAGLRQRGAAFHGEGSAKKTDAEPLSAVTSARHHPTTMTRAEYWRAQIRRIVILLAVWAIVAFGLSIFAAPALNAISFGGVPLGFWMAQQGSIFVFVALIWIYARTSDRADEAAGLAETPDTTTASGEGH